MDTIGRPPGTRVFRLPAGIALLAFLAIAAFFLWEEHEAHILGALPWLLLLACPAIHLLLHRGHARKDGAHESPAGDPDRPGAHDRPDDAGSR